MKSKIRLGTFETNSSSMHTVVLTKHKDEYISPKDVIQDLNNNPKLIDRMKITKKYNPNGDKFHILCETDTFGREFRLLTSWYDKMIYTLANCRSFDDAELLGEAVKNYIGNGCQGIMLDKGYYNQPSDVIEMNNDCPAVDRYAVSYDYFGEIDHQSSDVLDNAFDALGTGMTLEQKMQMIIFSNEVIIVVDGDETDGFRDLLNSGFFEAGLFTKILHETYDRESYKHISSEFIDIYQNDEDCLSDCSDKEDYTI